MKNLLIVLDLDETLIHSSDLRISSDFEFGSFSVLVRPFAKEFVRYLLDRFDVGIWTSSTFDYASEILHGLGFNQDEFAFVWAREKCTISYDSELMTQVYVKDLVKLKKFGYSLARILAIDDSPEKLSRQFGNLIRVSEWTGDSQDDELMRLLKYIVKVGSYPSVRRIEKRGWISSLPAKRIDSPASNAEHFEKAGEDL